VLQVNGSEHRRAVDVRSMLLDVLREQLAPTGTKKSCDLGQCGARTAVKPGGIIVSTLSQPPKEKARAHQARRMRYMAQPNGGQLREIGRLIEDGKVRPVVARTFPLLQVRAVQEALERGKLRGKVVLDITGA
jgi:NADPH:quinone reductase-like Zn-dependent oxidoreductase